MLFFGLTTGVVSDFSKIIFIFSKKRIMGEFGLRFIAKI